jgi:hypothetical protein
MCHNHALLDPGCPYNRAYNQYPAGWRQVSSKVAMYEYFNKVSWLELPWPVIHTIRQDIPHFKKLGLFGLATQYRENFGSNGLVYYVAAKLLWDPGLDAVFVTNPAGRWADASLYAVYGMLGDEVVSSAEAMRRIEKEIDAVRERAVGFVEFRGSGVSVPDGSTVAVEIGVGR